MWGYWESCGSQTFTEPFFSLVKSNQAHEGGERFHQSQGNVILKLQLMGWIQVTHLAPCDGDLPELVFQHWRFHILYEQQI